MVQQRRWQNRLSLRRLLLQGSQKSHRLPARALHPRLATERPQRPQRHVVALRWNDVRLPRCLRGMSFIFPSLFATISINLPELASPELNNCKSQLANRKSYFERISYVTG